jgi:aryl-alcohol dehydrogenase-like predicted oxidoreductase
MEKRRLGRTGQMSTVAVFGAVALADMTQAEADRVMRRVIAAGINHIDVAPSYGQAEVRLGPWLARERERFFLAGKTMERGREAAAEELRRSLSNLQVDSFDLYQLHAVTDLNELKQALDRDGALEAILEARAKGLVRWIGITAHGIEAPDVILQALAGYDFDTVMLPVNFILFSNKSYRQKCEELLAECRAKDLGVLAIKTLAKRPWGGRRAVYRTWYEPFDRIEQVQPAVDFTLSQDLTALCTSGDARLLPLIIKACQQFTRMSPIAQAMLIDQADRYEALWV